MLRSRFLTWHPGLEMNRIFRDYDRPVASGYPVVNAVANPDTVKLTVELPGYDPNEIKLSVLEKIMTLKGEREAVTLNDGEVYHRQERNHGKFARQIHLPFMVDADKVEAQMKDGILHIRLPRAESDKPKKITIEDN